MSSLRTSDGLWSRYVPVAFHVTYWDSLGWSDRFGQKKFDTLHETTAAHAKAPVYTPGVFVAGQEWRAWRRAPLAIDAPPDSVVGVLKVEMGDAIASVTFDSPGTFAQAERRPRVAAGQPDYAGAPRRKRRQEPASRIRRARAALGADADEQRHLARLGSHVGDRQERQSQAVAIWVVDAAGQPVQATGGWLQSAAGNAADLP